MAHARAAERGQGWSAPVQFWLAGRGLVTFSTFEEALAGVTEIQSDYEGHSAAARALAEDYFDSDSVLSRLLSRLGVG